MAFNDFATTWPSRNARLALSLEVLSAEIAVRHPDAVFLGALGDTSHAAEGNTSDHNPIVLDPHTGQGIVRAIDVGGPDAMLQSLRAHLWGLYSQQDPRLWFYGYAKGCSDNLINNWGLPFGTHVDTGDAGHLHISVTQTSYPSVPGGYLSAIDSTAPWGLDLSFGADMSIVIIFDIANPARASVVWDGHVQQIADGAETVALEHMASAAGVPANTPVTGVPTATYNDLIVRLDTYGQNQAIIAALGQILAEVRVHPAIPQGGAPSAQDIALEIGTALTKGAAA